jgi:hypothetical protein
MKKREALLEDFLKRSQLRHNVREPRVQANLVSPSCGPSGLPTGRDRSGQPSAELPLSCPAPPLGQRPTPVVPTGTCEVARPFGTIPLLAQERCPRATGCMRASHRTLRRKYLLSTIDIIMIPSRSTVVGHSREKVPVEFGDSVHCPNVLNHPPPGLSTKVDEIPQPLTACSCGFFLNGSASFFWHRGC